MSLRGRRTAFTLLELMVVATLLAMAVGVATLNLHGMSDQARLQVAASQVGVVYRLAACAAARGGRPRVLQFGRRGCTVSKPVYREGVWIWSLALRIDLVSKVSVRSVFPWGAEVDSADSEPPWDVVVTPGAWNSDFGLELGLDNGLRATARLDGITGMVRLKSVHDERG